MKTNSNSNKPLKTNLFVYVDDEKIGKLSIDEDSQLKCELPLDQSITVQRIWDVLKARGVNYIGDIVLDAPMPVPDEYLLSELWKALTLEGIELRRK
ncbi:MAG: hypothetical protein ABH846_02750 [Patescibacteria group bacterium]